MFLTEIVFQAVKMKIYTYENVITKVTNKCFYLFGMKMLHNVSEKTHHCFHTCKPHIVYMETRCLYVAVPFFFMELSRITVHKIQGRGIFVCKL